MSLLPPRDGGLLPSCATGAGRARSRRRRGRARRSGRRSGRPPRPAAGRTADAAPAPPNPRWRPGRRRTGRAASFTSLSTSAEPLREVLGDLDVAQRAALDRRGLGRADERAGLVDPHRHRHVREPEELVGDVRGVDQARVGRRGGVDEGAGVRRVDVEGDGDDREAVGPPAQRAGAATRAASRGSLTSWPRPAAVPCGRGGSRAETGCLGGPAAPDPRRLQWRAPARRTTDRAPTGRGRVVVTSGMRSRSATTLDV